MPEFQCVECGRVHVRHDEDATCGWERASRLEAENERLRKRAEAAELLVRPALDRNGVPDSTRSLEWNAGYRQRQREEWSRALYSEERARQAEVQRDRLADALRDVRSVTRLGDSDRYTQVQDAYAIAGAALAELEEE